MTVSPVRIGVIGTGAIGGFYGLMLARAGFDVHFLLRSEYAAVAGHGLRLNSQVHGALSLAPVQQDPWWQQSVLLPHFLLVADWSKNIVLNLAGHWFASGQLAPPVGMGSMLPSQ